jgi:RNA polymerase sigma-B factor
MQTLSVHPAPVAVPTRAQRAREEARLFARYQRTGDQAARAELVERFLPLARHLANRYRDRAEYDDLFQVASYALVKAIDRYDLDRGLAFSSFAVPTILGELKRYFRDHGWSVRVPRDVQDLVRRVERAAERLTAELGRSPTIEELAASCGATSEQVLEARGTATAHRAISLDGLVHEDDDEGPARLVGHEDAGYSTAEQSADLERLLSTLSDRERTVLRLRFQEDLVQREIAERVGLSQMQVSRVIANAIRRLQEEHGSQPAAPQAVRSRKPRAR